MFRERVTLNNYATTVVGYLDIVVDVRDAWWVVGWMNCLMVGRTVANKTICKG